MLGLASSLAVDERAMNISNGQVLLLTAGSFLESKQKQLSNQRAHAKKAVEERLALTAAKSSGPNGTGGPPMTMAKFTWKGNAASFEWRKIFHALTGKVGPDSGGILSECQFSPMAMRMYTDHRVMGQIVLPGVSHISLMAATASLGMTTGGGAMAQEFHVSIKEVLFERPYIVHSGTELIEAIANKVDPKTVTANRGGIPVAMEPLGVPTTYCRATNVTKERGIIKAEMEWAK